MEINSILQNAICSCAINKQGLNRLIFVKGTMTNQRYLQQLQNVMLVIRGA
jgi:hypothetical protein